MSSLMFSDLEVSIPVTVPRPISSVSQNVRSLQDSRTLIASLLVLFVLLSLSLITPAYDTAGCITGLLPPVA